MIKPAGPTCNLACEYCYYLDKAQYYPGSSLRMDYETLERVTAAYLQAHPGPEVTFGWQGGEPLLMGRDFYRRALELQAKYRLPGQQVTNAMQTNGTLIDEQWADFFAENHFLIGISLDGPPELHDRHRKDRAGQGSHPRVLAGLRQLQQRKVDYNVLVTVNRTNAEEPLKVYRYLRELGIEYLQFIPIVEREAPNSRKVTNWTTRPQPFGDFLCTVFDEWVRNDVGSIFVQIFESALSVWMGGPPTICVFSATCGRAAIVEHSGELYACDHFVYPEHRRGIVESAETLTAMMDSPEQQAFGLEKANLPTECLRCPVRRFCWGDCPKHRLRKTEDGKMISYLCPAYHQFFTQTAPILQAIASMIRAGRPAQEIMAILHDS